MMRLHIAYRTSHGHIAGVAAAAYVGHLEIDQAVYEIVGLGGAKDAQEMAAYGIGHAIELIESIGDNPPEMSVLEVFAPRIGFTDQFQHQPRKMSEGTAELAWKQLIELRSLRKCEFFVCDDYSKQILKAFDPELKCSAETAWKKGYASSQGVAERSERFIKQLDSSA